MDADDLTQELVLKWLVSPAHYEWGISFLIKMARQIRIDEWRRRNAQKRPQYVPLDEEESQTRDGEQTNIHNPLAERLQSSNNMDVLYQNDPATQEILREEKNERRQRVAARFSEIGLSKREAEAVLLIHFDGFTRQEAAHLLGISTATFYTLHSRAQKKLVQGGIKLPR
jgi:RNA polymerase sigma factor (sigma-70 family)